MGWPALHDDSLGSGHKITCELTHKSYFKLHGLSPFIVLAGAGAVRHGDRPVKVLAVETFSMRCSSFKRDLPAQKTLITMFI